MSGPYFISDQECAEHQLIGYLMMHPENVPEVHQIITCWKFDSPGLGRLFKAMCDLENQGVDIDPESLMNSLGDEVEQIEIWKLAKMIQNAPEEADCRTLALRILAAYDQRQGRH